MLATLPFPTTDLPLVLALPVLLAASAFFSGSETALFSLTGRQQHTLRAETGLVARAVGQLLSNVRMLLITLMLGNMTVNVFYFVISSILLLKLEAAPINPLWIAAGGIAPLLAIIIFGEIIPKLIANTVPMPWVRLAAPPLWLIHRFIAPIRLVLGHAVVTPLSRLTSPTERPPALSRDELEALLDSSQRRGVIDRREEVLLREVLNLARMKVRDVMVPRVDVRAVDADGPPERLRQLIESTGFTKYPVYRGDLDNVVGVIHARQFLLAGARGDLPDLAGLVRDVHFVPELQRVDQILQDLRKRSAVLAVVVDEFGGTAGLVTLKSVVQRIVGDLQGDDAETKTPAPAVEPVDDESFRVSGRLCVHDWANVFGREHVPPRVATVGGLLMTRLGRAPVVGDRVELGNLTLEVERMEGWRIESVRLSLREGK